MNSKHKDKLIRSIIINDWIVDRMIDIFISHNKDNACEGQTQPTEP